jgi:hypothetical protein
MSDDQVTESSDGNAVYRRTRAGQRELISPSGQLQPLERRFLAVVTGHTPLQVLQDLVGDEPALADAVATLRARGLIAPEAELEDDDAAASWLTFAPAGTPGAGTLAA